MPELRAVISLEVDGDSIAISPIIRTLNVTEDALASFVQAADNGSTYHQLEGSVMPILQAVLVMTDQAYNLQFAAGPLAMSANGLVLILGANLTAGASTNCRINIPGTTDANAKALSGGT